MAQKNLNFGTSAGDNTGDILFNIFSDVEDNFTDLYTVTGANTTAISLNTAHRVSAHAPSNADNTSANETSHADVVVDGDIGTTVQAWDAELDIWATKTESGYLLVDGSRDSTGDQLFTKHVAIGGDASVGAVEILTVKGTLTATGIGNQLRAVEIEATSGGGQIATSLVGMAFTSSVSNVGGFSSSAGLSSTSTIKSTQTSALTNVVGFTSSLKTEVGSVGPTVFKSFQTGTSTGIAGGKPVSIYGFQAQDQGLAGMTNNIGVLVENMKAATNNHGIVLNGDGLGSDIVFGAGKDNKIYHDGTRLRIDGLTDTAIGTETLSRFIEINIGGTLRKIAIVA